MPSAGITSGTPSWTMLSSVPKGDLLKPDGHLDFAGQAPIVKLVGIPDDFLWYQFHVASRGTLSADHSFTCLIFDPMSP
jgi:hypothetical protein